MPVVSWAQALKLGPEGLAAKLGDESEAGLDSAAVYYAAAKRMQTVLMPSGEELEGMAGQ